MKAVWVVLVILLAAFVIYPPDFSDTNSSSVPAIPPFHPNARVRSLADVQPGGAPGAIVCDDLPSVQNVAEGYRDYWIDAIRERMMGPKVRELEGPPAAKPDPDLFGCSLLPPGTAVEIKGWVTQGVPEIIAQRPDGNWIYGVTLENMLSGS